MSVCGYHGQQVTLNIAQVSLGVSVAVLCFRLLLECPCTAAVVQGVVRMQCPFDRLTEIYTHSQAVYEMLNVRRCSLEHAALCIVQHQPKHRPGSHSRDLDPSFQPKTRLQTFVFMYVPVSDCECGAIALSGGHGCL